jgi:cytochrome c oxidase assembly protein subunit 15
MPSADLSLGTPRWLHRWAVLTVAATALLLAIGAVVTTFKVGMADPVWPTYPWHLLLISWDEPSAGFLIEHTHRLAGYIVGCCVILLAVGLWLAAPRRLAWLGVVALGGVIAQGLLGGFRVYLHALFGPNLAAIHGLFAQVVFSLLVGLAVLTSPRFAAAALPGEDSRRLLRPGLVLTTAAFAQLASGVLLRHLGDTIAQRVHFATAFAVVGAAAWLGAVVAASPDARRLLGGPLLLLGGFLAVQVLLGVEAWLSKFSGVVLPELQTVTIPQAVIRTAHVPIGSWVLAASVAITLLASRRAPQPVGQTFLSACASADRNVCPTPIHLEPTA